MLWHLARSQNHFSMVFSVGNDQYLNICECVLLCLTLQGTFESPNDRPEVPPAFVAVASKQREGIQQGVLHRRQTVKVGGSKRVLDLAVAEAVAKHGLEQFMLSCVRIGSVSYSRGRELAGANGYLVKQ